MQKPLLVNESQRLAMLCEEMEQFTTAFSHDLRGALQLIAGYADLLAAEGDGPLEPVQREHIRFIQAGAKGVLQTLKTGQARLQELIRLSSQPK